MAINRMARTRFFVLNACVVGRLLQDERRRRAICVVLLKFWHRCGMFSLDF